MEVTIIIALILYALAIILAIKLIKNVLVTIGTIIVISLLLMAATGLFVYNEIDELQNTLPVSNNLILLTEQQQVLSGAVILPIEGGMLHEGIKFLDNETVDYLSSYLSSEDYDSMLNVIRTSDFVDSQIIEERDLLDETYKIFFIDITVLKESPVNEINLAELAGVDSGDFIFDPIPRDSVIEIIRSDDPWLLLADFIDVSVPDLSALETQLEQQGLEILDETYDDLDNRTDEIKNEIISGLREGLISQFGHDDLSSLLFLLNLFSLIENEGAEGLMYLYTHYSDENIYIKDDSIIFSLLRLSPDALITAVINEAHNAASSMSDQVSDRIAEEASNQESISDLDEVEKLDESNYDLEELDLEDPDFDELQEMAEELGIDLD